MQSGWWRLRSSSASLPSHLYEPSHNLFQSDAAILMFSAQIADGFSTIFS
ncbi:Major facilitator superfamily protein [Perilla frutescens var. hirtella]|nr:Major facilitator superfamily protein [Perilla frutescens var. hirtella]